MLFEIITILTTLLSIFFIGLYIFEKNKNRTLNLQYNIFEAQALGHAATLRDHETGVHNIRVTYLSSLFGEVLGLDKKSMQNLMKGAFLHDVGKIGISDTILLKNGALDDDEWKIMQNHTTLGVELVKNIPWFSDAQDVILHHHEKYDGSGYPAGLKGEEIPYHARIFALVDVFDALMSKRPYKIALSKEASIKIIKESSPSHFDPTLTTKFIHFLHTLDTNLYLKSEENLRELLVKRRKKIFGI